MALDHVHGPAFMFRYRDAQRLVLDRAEAVAHGRMRGTLTTAELDRLTDAQTALDKLRDLYLRGTALDGS